MSWFDTAGFASLAKSALKEAQKTFDKALDLEAVDEKTSLSDAGEKDESESFFSAFGLGGGPSQSSGDPAGGAERAAASLWGSLGGSLLRDPPPAESAAGGQHSSAEPEPEPVTMPPNGLSRTGPALTTSVSSERWAEPPSASPAGDLTPLRADSPSLDGFQSSVLVVASPTSEWAAPLPSTETATPESIEVLDGVDQDWETGWEAAGDSTGTIQDPDAPPESLHSSNSSCHTLVSPDGGAAYNATVAPPRGRPVESPAESSSSESFVRLGVGATPLTSPDVELVTSPEVGNMTSPDVEVMTSPDVEVVTSPEAGNMTSPDVEVVTSPDVEIVKPLADGKAADVVVSPSDVASPDVEVVTSPDGEISAPPEAAELAATGDRLSVADSAPQAAVSGDRGGGTDTGRSPRAVPAVPPQPAHSTDAADGHSGPSEPARWDTVSSVEPVNSVELINSEAGSSVEPINSEPGSSTEPVSSVEPIFSEPGSSVEPVSSEPVSSEPGSSVGPCSSVDPVSSEPGSSVGLVSSVDPVSSEPVSSTSDCAGPVLCGREAGGAQRPGSGSPPRETSAEPSQTGSADSGGRGLSPHESGHTSADEIETATSSDVEVLTSPLTECRPLAAPQARARRAALVADCRADTPSSDGSHPALLPTGHREPGHRRNLSQTSVASSDLDPESERWPRRLAELQDVLTAREAKMMELSRLNVTLQEDNSNMHSRMELLESQLARSTSAPGGQQERLSAERDALHRQLAEARRRCAALEEAVLERDSTAEELRAEGEKLSREQLKLSTVIKRLRAKEREQEAAAKKLEEKLCRLASESGHLTEQLASARDSEREQSRVQKQLAGQLTRAEREAAEALREAEQARAAKTALETALQTAHRECADLERRARQQDSEAASRALSAETEARQRLERTLAEHRAGQDREREDLLAQTEDLRLTLRRAERDSARREEGYQAEAAELQRRLLDSEARNQQLADSVAMATRPLQRQLETLQAALSTQQHSWERAERALTEKNVELHRQLAAVTERERHVTGQYAEVTARQAPLEASLAELRTERSRAADREAALETRLAHTTAENERCLSERAASERQLADQLAAARREQELLERHLATERAALAAERERSAALLAQVQERARQLSHSQSVSESLASQLSTPRTSPTPSLSRISFSSSLHELESVFDPGTPRPAGVSLYDSVRAAGQGGATLVESLTAQLKQRDGELAQLRAERSELESCRHRLGSELARLSAELETASEAGRRLQERTAELRQLEATYNALLQMYGEKAEESEELKLDLADVKEMYKQQIDQLTQRAAGPPS